MGSCVLPHGLLLFWAYSALMFILGWLHRGEIDALKARWPKRQPPTPPSEGGAS